MMEPVLPARRYSFAEFVGKFPPVPMPVVLGEETHHVFDTENGVLPYGMIQQFIHPVEGTEEDDEYTEYLPCFAVQDAEQFIALVWWKAGLLNYHYVLATFNAKGERIDHRVIGFTRVVDGKVQRAVATIDEEFIIWIAEGAAPAADEAFDPTTSRTYSLEILANGEIVKG
jgi:hypothetical protein